MIRSLFDLPETSTPRPMSKQETRLLELFKRGGKFTVTDITISTGQCDPQGHIRNLRKRGINIADEWVSENGSRFKRYWLAE